MRIIQFRQLVISLFDFFVRIFSRKEFVSLFLVLWLILFHPLNIAYAADGDNAVFSFEPLNGLEGENEIKLVVNTDNAAINHLIFDIVDPNPADEPVFDMDGSGDPVSFPRSGQSVLGTQTPFTSASGDTGYDLASANPANTAAYSALNFAILTADKNLPEGKGGLLRFDTDTAIYVNAQRKGDILDTYMVLANEAPEITTNTVKVSGNDLYNSTAAPSAVTPLPATLVQNVSVTPTFTFTATDNTDASVQRKMQIYKRLDDDSWGYPGSATKTVTFSRSGTTMTFSSTLSGGSALDFSSYYKVVFTVTDDQGATNNQTYYFSTTADNSAPSQIDDASMTFISDSDTRSEVISQIVFTNSSDNSAVSNYYLWTKDYLVAKDIINSDGTPDLALDTNADLSVSDEEFNVGLRALVDEELYVATVSRAAAGSSPYLRITGDDVDKTDDMGTPGDSGDDLYLVPNSLSQDIFYLVAADDAATIAGASVPNFSDFTVVEKYGDVFGAEVQLSVGGNTYAYIVGDGSLDVWDAIHSYRNIIGRVDEFPIMRPDFLHSNKYSYPSNISTAGATLVP